MRAGRLREAAERIEAFQALAPFDYGPALHLPYLAIELGDRALLERSLQRLLVYAIRELNQRESRDIEVIPASDVGSPVSSRFRQGSVESRTLSSRLLANPSKSPIMQVRSP